MKQELLSAANFVTHLIRLSSTNLSEKKLLSFRNQLVEQLYQKYKDHWFPNLPSKGSGYRCLRINQHMDPQIKKAAEACAIPLPLVQQSLPNMLMMWIDPLEVCVRVGETGPLCILYDSQSYHEWRPRQPLPHKKNCCLLL